MSDDSTTHLLDRYHRHWPVVLWALIMALVTWAMLDGGKASQLPRFLLATGLLTGLMWLFWAGEKRRRVIVSSGGIVEKGLIFERVIRFPDVRAYDMTLADDSLGISDEGIGEFFVSLFAQFTVRPFRWVLRRFVYGAQSDVFYRGVLRLYDVDRKRIYGLEASDGWQDVEELFREITHRLDQRSDVQKPHVPVVV